MRMNLTAIGSVQSPDSDGKAYRMKPVAEPDCDVVLWRRFRSGDVEAFAALVRHWEHRLLRVAVRIVGDLHEAEEVRQTVLLKLVESSPDGLRSPGGFAAWMYRCTVNAAIGAVRRRDRFSRLRTLVAVHRRPDPPDTPASSIAAMDEAACLRRALAGLDPVDRALLALRFEEDLSFPEMAAVVGRPAATVKSRVHRSVSRLREILDRDAPSNRSTT